MNPGYALLLLAVGWLVGHHFLPTSQSATAAVAFSAVGGESASGSPTPSAKSADSAATRWEARKTSNENSLRDAARRMALAPPPALHEFLAGAADTDVLRAALLEDAVFWAFCRNPAAGLAQLSVLPDTSATQNLVAKTLHFFPPKDLPLVLDWYQKLPVGQLRITALREINPVLARRDPAKAIALTAALPPDTDENGNSRQILLSALLSARADPTDPGTWEKELSAFPAADRKFLHTALVSSQFQNLFNGDKAGAVALLSRLPAGDYQERAVDLFQNWAQYDPLRAAPEIEKLPEAYQIPELYTSFAMKWAQGNVSSSSAWVNSLPPGPSRNAAARGLAQGLAKDYPSDALVWAGTLDSPEARAQTVGDILAKSAPEKRQQLESAIAALPLAPEEIATLQNLSRP